MPDIKLYDLACPKELREAEALILKQRPAAGGERSDIRDSVGFALSGGGIRSATFCLGVFQRLARENLLAKVDYISSVSGGGYFASFLGRVFAREDVTTMDHVREVLAPDRPSGPDVEVPGESGADGAAGAARKMVDWRPHVLRWLRENSRYLAPKGAGDLLLDIAVVLRNWVAIQIVMLSFVFLVFATAQIIRGLLEGAFGRAALQCYFPFGEWLWWSPFVIPAAVVLVFIAVPFGWAYWLVEKASDYWIAPFFGAVAAVLFAAVVAIASRVQGSTMFWPSVTVAATGALALGCGLITAIAAWIGAWKEERKTPFTSDAERELYKRRQARNWLSRWLKNALLVAGLIGAFALIDTFGQTLYAIKIAQKFQLRKFAIASYAAFSAIAAGAKWVVAQLPHKPNGRGPRPSVSMLAGVAAIVLLVTVLSLVDAASHAVVWELRIPDQAPAALLGTACHGVAACAPTTHPCADKYRFLEPPSAHNWFDALSSVFSSVNPAPGHNWLDALRRVFSSVKSSAIPWPIPRHFTFRAAAPGVWLAVFILSLLFGWTWTFVNRSSLLALYGARLCRAYLGASNVRRYEPAGASLSEIDRGDDIDQQRYWPPAQAAFTKKEGFSSPYKKGAPIHLVNVTINETIDPVSQVQQQDRKGIGMAIGPAAISAGVRHHVVFDQSVNIVGRQYDKVSIFPPDGFRMFDYGAGKPRGRDIPYLGERLSLGDWTSISGAAFSTGLGFRTSMALSFLAGFFNVRLGYWWDSGVDPQSRERKSRESRWRQWLQHWISKLFFPVQRMLLDEFTARFHGTTRRRWLLTDGGHFENMGAYELIRRRLKMIVVIDAEADPDYTLEGVANLVRKARLDFAAEVVFLNEQKLDAAVDPAARRYFGTLEQLQRGDWSEEPVKDPNSARASRLHVDPLEERLSLAHAALARIYYEGAETHGSTLLLIKPSLTGDESADVRRYHSDHCDFPQETTAEQFFNESQWESYRKLGDHIARKLFQPVSAGRGFIPRALKPL